MRQQFAASLAFLIALPVCAESSTNLRVAGIVAPTCSLLTEAVSLEPNGLGTWTGTAGYSCNSGHLVVLSVSEALAGATIEIDGAPSSTVDEVGQAVLYRRAPHFGTSVVKIRTLNTLQNVNARIMVQPL